jgi:FixJ family two-component response regulator
MPGMSGLDLHRKLVSSARRIPTLLITAYPDERIQAEALQAGVICYLAKPFKETELLLHIRSALGRQGVDSEEP